MYCSNGVQYSMNRIWWNFNWAEFQWISGNFSFGVPSYSVHTVVQVLVIRKVKSLKLSIPLWIRFLLSDSNWTYRFGDESLKLILFNTAWRKFETVFETVSETQFLSWFRHGTIMGDLGRWSHRWLRLN